MYKFEKLFVWKESLKLSQDCYATARQLPAYERSALADQLRRASTSIMLNIAEGSGANSDKEFMRFLYVSRKSLYEVVALVKFTEVQYPRIDTDELLDQLNVVGKQLNGLINKLKADSK